MKAVEVNGLSKSYGQRTIFNDISLSAERGHMVAITGPSGAGKSTLLSCVGMLEPFDEGSVTLCGKNIAQLGRSQKTALLRKDVGFLFQNYALVEELTVGENLAFAQAYARVSAAEKRKAREEALEQVGLAGRGQAKVYELSGGEQQRAALARLLLRDLAIVLADEPTGALDAANREAVMFQLALLRDKGAAVLIVAHDPAVVTSCDVTFEMPVAHRQCELVGGPTSVEG